MNERTTGFSSLGILGVCFLRISAKRRFYGCNCRSQVRLDPKQLQTRGHKVRGHPLLTPPCYRRAYFPPKRANVCRVVGRRALLPRNRSPQGFPPVVWRRCLPSLLPRTITTKGFPQKILQPQDWRQCSGESYSWFGGIGERRKSAITSSVLLLIFDCGTPLKHDRIVYDG